CNVAFVSFATNLVEADDNGAIDVFVHDHDSHPTITSVSPDYGPNSGISGVVITGSNFTGATEVRFGTNLVSFTVDSDSQISANLGRTGTRGFVDVSVKVACTGALTDGFDYFAPPESIGIPCSATSYLTWSGAPTLAQSYTDTTQNLGANNQVLLVDWTDSS